MDIATFKQQNPAYSDVPDLELADALHAKYYSDVPRDQFLQQVGIAGQQSNAFSTSMPRDQYQKSFVAMNPNADQAALDSAMSGYDQDAAARAAAKVAAPADRFATLQSPEKTFNDRLNKRLQQHTADVNGDRADAAAPGIVPALPGRLAPQPEAHVPTAFEETAGNAVGGLIKTLMGSLGAAAALTGNDQLANDMDVGRAQIDERMKQMGSDTLTGRVSDIIGSVAPALLAPEGIAAQLATNTGLFGIPAFRDTYKAQLAAGRDQSVALQHAIAAAGLNTALPMVAPGGMRALSKAIGTADLAGAKGAAASLGQAAVEGAGFSAASTATDKAIDLANGVQNNNPWVDTKDMAANALAFGGLRLPHAAVVGMSAPAEAPRPAPVADIASAKTMDQAVAAASAAVPDINPEALRSANDTAVADLLRQIRPIEKAPVVEPLATKEAVDATPADLPPVNELGRGAADYGGGLERPVIGPGVAEQVGGERSANTAPADAIAGADVLGADRPANPEPALRVADAGTPIYENWHAFPDNSGTKGIPRAEMPQIDSTHHGALVNFLNARGVEHEPLQLAPETLKPTQAEFSPGKVDRASQDTSDRSVLVSSDGHVLDGHHQWLSNLEQGTPVKAIRLNAPIDQLLQHAREFPSARAADGAVPEEAAQFFKPAEQEHADGGQQPIEATPRTLTERERVGAMRDVAVLNRALQRTGMDPVQPLREIPTGQHAIAAEVAKAFGIKVRFVSSNDKFQGVAHNGVAFLTEKMKHPVIAIAGHEVFHTMEQTQPEFASRLKNQIDSYLHEGVVEGKLQRLQLVTPTEVTRDTARSEVIADLHGSMWMDPKFWREMAEKDQNLFRVTAYRFMQVLTKAAESMRGTPFWAEDLVTDVAKVRSLIADAWVERNAARKVAAESDPQFSRNMPDAIIGGQLGDLSKHPDYSEAKAGDVDAAVRVTRDVVTPDLIERVKAIAGAEKPIIQPVTAIEASGRNRIPMVAAERLSHELGLPVGYDIVQANSPKRTAMAGVDRLFGRPEFDGKVERGKSYILLDDTITQGGTFAALAKHIEDGGGHVIGSVALTGKQYSAKMALSDSTLSRVREKYGDLEQQFQAAAGHGFDALTESEARYLANFHPSDAIRDRIAARGQQDGSGPRSQVDTDGKDPGELKFSRVGEGDESSPDQIKPEGPLTGVARKLSSIIHVAKNGALEVAQLVVPMAGGSEKARAMSKDFANSMRRANAQWNMFDRVLKNNYSESQLEHMWRAADAENDLRRSGQTSDTEGLNSLSPGERATVELLHQYGQELWDQAKKVGLVEGDGVAYWTPRVAARIYADGSTEALKANTPGEFSRDARNLRTTASSIKSRQHETTAESEAALKVKFGDDAEYVKNIRVMPRAMAQLERAIAGRTLVNQIKAHGQLAGEELFSDTGGRNFREIDHPALKRWQPKMEWHPEDPVALEQRGLEVRPDGVYREGDKLASYRIGEGGQVEKYRPVLDEDGKPIMVSSPLFVRKDFYGPLSSVFSKEPHAVYRALMDLKGSVTSMIMLSPLTHNLVIWGKAISTMTTTMGWKNNLKNAATLGARAYFVGHQARKDFGLMRNLIEAGLVPVSGRGMSEDLGSIANRIEPGHSLVSKAVGAAFDMASPTAGNAARKAVDKAGEIWHEKLLWDRVADMQAGMAVMMRSSLLDKGFDDYTASRIAAHFANRYGGMIPQEAMSRAAHMLLNLSLFSKSFTVTNIGAYKDALQGLPRDVQAQIKLHAFEVQRALGKSEEQATKEAGRQLSKANSATRAKGVAIIALDIAAMAAVTSLTQSLIRGATWDEVKDGLGDRWQSLKTRFGENPFSVLAHPLDTVAGLSETSGNPHGKEDRIRVGEDEQGNSYYLRLPVGKVAEELRAYGNLSTGLHLLHNKLSTFVKPFADLMAGEDAQGRRVINPDDNVLKQIAGFAAYWVKSQLPAEDAQALYHVAKGDADLMDKAKLAGTMTGLTISKVAGGDVAAEMRYQDREQQARVHDVLPDVREAVRRGDYDKAYELLEPLNLTGREESHLISRIENPTQVVNRQSLKKFNQHASDEQKAKMNNLRDR